MNKIHKSNNYKNLKDKAYYLIVCWEETETIVYTVTIHAHCTDSKYVKSYLHLFIRTSTFLPSYNTDLGFMVHTF